MNHTIFLEKHKQHNAKLVDFAGWEMPINYPDGIIKESNFVRDDAGMFDVSHMGRVEISGKNSRDLIQKMLPINIDSLEASIAKYTLLINDKEEILDDLIVYQISDEKFLLVINASNTDEDLKWIKSINNNSIIENITEKTGMLAIQGPNAIKKINSITNNSLANLGRYRHKEINLGGASVFVARTGYTGEDGVEIIFQNSHANAIWDNLHKLSINPCGLGARDLLRIEAGLHLYGHEITKESNPYNIGLGRLLETSSKNYINYEYINGDKIKAGKDVLVGLIIKDRGIAREGNEIYINDKIIGKITSGTHSPRIKSAIAIGKLNKKFNNSKNTVKIKVREKYLEAEIIKLPFYRRKK